MKNNKAVTLIALIITIIILLILTGVVISMTVGENGLIKKAQMAVDEYEKASNKEKNMLEQFQYETGKGNLPENTENTEAGTEVKMPEKWYSTTSAYVSTEDGRTVKKMVSVASVIAIATGGGETVPVPEGFFYVGGKVNSGVVISDDARDRNKYAGIADVPAGAIYNSDGTVKQYTEEEYKKLSEEEKKAVLMGNQFVWIPVSESEYVKKKWGKMANNKDPWNANWDSTANTAELPQIQKYGGFYVGRYEAGTSNITLSTRINFASKNTVTLSDWRNDNFSIRDGLNHTVESGKITLKAGEIPYYHADYDTALKLSNNMYKTEYVQSGLVTGTMWDAIMKFIAKKADGTSDNTIVEKGNWGNYTNGSVTYTTGNGRYASVDSSTGVINTTGDVGFVVSDGKYHYGIKTTAISENVKKKNLYDIAGNLWEWTQEAAYPDTTYRSYMLRGGCFFDSSATNTSPCFRYANYATRSCTTFGFRPVLYIK